MTCKQNLTSTEGHLTARMSKKDQQGLVSTKKKVEWLPSDEET